MNFGEAGRRAATGYIEGQFPPPGPRPPMLRSVSVFTQISFTLAAADVAHMPMYMYVDVHVNMNVFILYGVLIMVF